MSEVGIVVIGRNEGDRLRRCLNSVIGHGHAVVYVDSGSSDGSVDLARSLGAEVVNLDRSTPFTAARARNEGFNRLLLNDPGVRFAQFIDGDCELVDGWLGRGRREIEAHPDWAVVCGRLRERFRDRSIYNRLADIEWDTPVGPLKACGGIAMARGSAFRQVAGFDSSMIGGEEPDLCLRLRLQGWTIYRIDAEMALHDIAMTRFRQWWRRSVRSGHAYAEGAAMHGALPERHWVREMISVCSWGVVLPSVVLGLGWPTRGLSLVLLANYGFLHQRIARRSRGHGLSPCDARLYAFSCVLAKFPQAVGVARYGLSRLQGRRHRPLVEYK